VCVCVCVCVTQFVYVRGTVCMKSCVMKRKMERVSFLVWFEFVCCVTFARTCFVSFSFSLQNMNAWLLHHPLLFAFLCVWHSHNTHTHTHTHSLSLSREWTRTRARSWAPWPHSLGYAEIQVCMSLCFVCMYDFVHVCRCACVHVCVCAHVCLCTCEHARVRLLHFRCICMFVYVYICIYMYVYVYIYIYIYICNQIRLMPLRRFDPVAGLIWKGALHWEVPPPFLNLVYYTGCGDLLTMDSDKRRGRCDPASTSSICCSWNSIPQSPLVQSWQISALFELFSTSF
jgi:hypothetical protein